MQTGLFLNMTAANRQTIRFAVNLVRCGNQREDKSHEDLGGAREASSCVAWRYCYLNGPLLINCVSRGRNEHAIRILPHKLI